MRASSRVGATFIEYRPENLQINSFSCHSILIFIKSYLVCVLKGD